jgi:nitroreductase
MDSSEFFDFLTSRSSVRGYQDDEVSEHELVFILDSASTAPSAGNLEAWDVVVVKDLDQKEALAAAAYEQTHVAEAPVLFVVCANYVRSMSRYGDRGILYAVQDATIACTYMMLAAHAERLASCWVGAIDENEVRAILGLPPHVRPLAILTVGKSRMKAPLTERMAVGEHVHMDTW